MRKRDIIKLHKPDGKEIHIISHFICEMEELEGETILKKINGDMTAVKESVEEILRIIDKNDTFTFRYDNTYKTP